MSNSRASVAERAELKLYLHLGIAQNILFSTPLRKGAPVASRKTVLNLAKEMTNEKHAYEGSWNVKPLSGKPSVTVRCKRSHMEMSLLASAIYAVVGERYSEQIEWGEMIQAYAIYTNMRSVANMTGNQVTPSTAHFACKEFIDKEAVIPYCRPCNIRYYSSAYQDLISGCPCCGKVGEGDSFGAVEDVA